jgi:hypothetical protein
MAALGADFVGRVQLCPVLQAGHLLLHVSLSLDQGPFGNTDHSKALPLEAVIVSGGGL